MLKSKLVLVLILLSCDFAMRAQDYKVVSVESLPMDMTAREHIKSDENGRQCAVLRIATQNITPAQREGFFFEGDYGSFVVDRNIVDGEVWLWVSPGLKTLKIRHGQLGRWELHVTDFGIKVESLHTYKVVIQGTMALPPQIEVEPEITQQYLVFQISPANAMLEVEGQLWEVGPDGTALKFVNFGTYSYRVQAPNYLPVTGSVMVNDPESTQIVPITLLPDFVELTLEVDADAEIWVNNERKGVRSWTGQLGKGVYKIECKRTDHETSITTLEINDNMAGQTITLPAPTPICGSLNIESTPNFATVYIDGVKVGETPRFINEILIGRHEICLTKEGYTEHKETVIVKKGESTSVIVTLKGNQNTLHQPKPQQADPQQPRPRQEMTQQSSSMFFAMANAAYSIAPQTSFGLTVGSVKQLGWYASLNSNFVFKNADFECDFTGTIDGISFEYSYSGEKSTSFLAATAGVILRVSDPIYAYMGGGYGYRNAYWELDNGSWTKCTDDSCRGLSLDAGLMIHFGSLGLSFGVQTVGVKFMEAKIGIGYTLKR